MKKLVLATLTFSTILSSCGQKVNHSTETSGKYENSIVLGKYNDVVTASSFDVDTLSDVPRSVNLIADMTEPKNQSDRGTCTFFSTAALIEATIKKDQKLNVNISEEYMNYITKMTGAYSRQEGSQVYNNVNAVNRRGLLLERDSSYQASWFEKGLPCEKYKSEDSSAPAECFSHKSPDSETLKKVISAKGLEFTGAEKDTNEVIRFLATEKRPLTASIAVNFNGWPQSGDVYHDETLRKQCLNNTATCGGHSILITGYDLDKGVFFFKNSWGADWGNNGYGTMTIATFDRYAGYDLYYAKLTEALEIPENANEDLLNVSDLSFTQEKIGNILAIKVNTKVSEAKGRMIYVSSFLTKKKDAALDISDANNSLMELTSSEQLATQETFIRAVHYSVTPANELVWDEANPLTLNFLKGTEVSIKAALNSEAESYLRTSVYVHTDTDSWKVLKRQYLPLAK